MYNEKFLREFGHKVQKVYADFEVNSFVDNLIDSEWERLTLKGRMRRITQVLGIFLPASYEEALRILFLIDENCIGFPYMFFPDFVEVYGQSEENWELSMKALERFTQRSSSEFAIRPFIVKNTERAMEQMMIWAKHPNEHVRRLASEGCRPRLPWGMALQNFKEEPSKVIDILEQLKNDSSLYVRKSVANNINDISKDNPQVVINLLKKWKGKNLNTDWILKKGCRTLIKAAAPEVMELFGYTNFTDKEFKITKALISVSPTKIKMGESCELRYEVHIPKGKEVQLRIEYGIDFVKARGNTSRKLFLISDKTVEGGRHIKGKKAHSFADLTTRRHYPGKHKITLLVNGQKVAASIVEITPNE
jgi:3-methyladenine DNA glycosylase AlkC